MGLLEREQQCDGCIEADQLCGVDEADGGGVLAWGEAR